MTTHVFRILILLVLTASGLAGTSAPPRSVAGGGRTCAAIVVFVAVCDSECNVCKNLPVDLPARDADQPPEHNIGEPAW